MEKKYFVLTGTNYMSIIMRPPKPKINVFRYSKDNPNGFPLQGYVKVGDKIVISYMDIKKDNEDKKPDY